MGSRSNLGASSLRGVDGLSALRTENAALVRKINELTEAIQTLEIQNTDININLERFKRTANK